MNLQPEDTRAILECVIKKEQIVGLDISNRGSDWLNRVSDSCVLLQKMLEKNKVLMRVELEGLNLRDKGVEAIERAYKMNNNPSLFYLNLKNNNLSRGSFPILKTILSKGSLKDLDLSDNPMGDDGI